MSRARRVRCLRMAALHSRSSKPRPARELHLLLMRRWQAHAELPEEERERIDAERMVPTGETARLLRKALDGGMGRW